MSRIRITAYLFLLTVCFLGVSEYEYRLAVSVEEVR